MKQLREATIEALVQVEQLILMCSPDNYNLPSAHSSSGIGRHVRHILDHFLAVRAGLDSGIVDYNMRNRDCRLEDDPELALELVDQIKSWLIELTFEDQPITIESEISVNATLSTEMPSTLSRELCYLINHTIHHVAYATLVAKQIGIGVDQELGIAPGTATYLRERCSSA